jgi:hypothetical protein
MVDCLRSRFGHRPKHFTGSRVLDGDARALGCLDACGCFSGCGGHGVPPAFQVLDMSVLDVSLVQLRPSRVLWPVAA